MNATAEFETPEASYRYDLGDIHISFTALSHYEPHYTWGDVPYYRMSDPSPVSVSMSFEESEGWSETHPEIGTVSTFTLSDDTGRELVMEGVQITSIERAPEGHVQVSMLCYGGGLQTDVKDIPAPEAPVQTMTRIQLLLEG